MKYKGKRGSTEQKKKVVILTHYFPPMQHITLRPYYLAKYLSEMGYDVSVITTRKLPIHGIISKEKNYDFSFDVIEAPHEPFDIFFRVLRALRRSNSDGEETKSGSAGEKANILLFLKEVRDFFLRIFGPNFDIFLSWIPFALREIIKLKRKKGIDVLITTFPPPAVHITGFLAKKLFPEMLWIADYRDLWSYDILFGAKLGKRLSQIFEKHIVSHADRITTISFALLSVIKNELGVEHVSLIRNSFSPELGERLMKLKGKKGSPKSWKGKTVQNQSERKKVFVYTGALYPKYRDPSHFLQALSILKKKYKNLPEKIKVDIYGIPNFDISSWVRKFGVDDVVFYKGLISWEESLRVQSEADYLLFFNITEVSRSEEVDKGIVTGKIYEYITSGTPIISIGRFEDAEANLIIKETGTGVFVENEPEKIAEFLEGLIYKGKKIPFSPKLNKIMEYSAENMAQKFAEIIEEKSKEVRKKKNRR